MEKCMIKWSQKGKEFTYSMHELKCKYINITLYKLTVEYSFNYFQQQRSQFPSRSCWKSLYTTQFQCIATKMNSDLMVRLFEICVLRMKPLSQDFTFHQFSVCVPNIKDNTGSSKFLLVQQCSAS